MSIHDQILAADDIILEQVSIPELGDMTLYVKTMTAAERDSFEISCVKNGKQDLNNMRAKLCVRTLVDEKGERIFTDTEAEQLGKKSTKALQKIFNVATRINALTPKDMEELVKNSKPDQSADSSSG